MRMLFAFITNKSDSELKKVLLVVTTITSFEFTDVP